MESDMRQSGIDVVGKVPWGTHFCQFYETNQDLIETLVPYFREGLVANEFCMWITSEPLQVDQAIEALRAAVPDLDEYIEKGQIEILDYSQWYTRSGKFSADEVLQGWVDKLSAALEQGYEGLRLSGNTFWLEQANWDDFTRYEEAVNNVIGQYRMLAICTYCLQKCSALEILDVVANHQFALIKRSGRWGIIESAQHQKTAQALQESEQRYATTLASIGDAVIATDIAGKITFMNAVAEDLTGWTLHEASMIPVQEVFNIINEYTRRKVDDPVTKVLEMGAIVGLANHTILVRKDGTEIPIDDSGAPIKDRDGNTTGVVLVFRDITERKKMEDELALLASFPKLNPNPVVEVDLAGQVHFLNPAAQQLFPDLQESGCSNPWLTDWGAVVQTFSENETRKHIREISVGERWYQQAMSSVPGTGRIRIYGLDITERKRAEQANKEKQRQNEFLANIIERSAQPFGVGYPDGRLGLVNKAFEQLTGYSREELQSIDWTKTLTPQEWLEIEQLKLEELHHTGQPVRYEKEYIKKDGTRVPIELLVHIVTDSMENHNYTIHS